MTTFDHVVVVRSHVDRRDAPPTTQAHHGRVGPDEDVDAGSRR